MNSGTRMGPYEVIEPLGAGGMGEVYRATDTRLKRDVALKILPQASAEEPGWKERFQREAEVLAALNHPNIAAIYGLEQDGGSQAIAMELVRGETLAERIGQGAIPLEETLRIALQMAAALEAAHGNGIVHRDLKPANVIVTPEGTVKVLDFGLAKAIEQDPAAEAQASESPTLALQATQAGIILGTAAYMSPEQAKGRAADHRADVWAVGVVLFEMLAGANPLPGDDLTELLASAVKADVDWEALPPGMPPPVRRWLRRCLNADPRQRYQAIGDLRLDMEAYLDDPEAAMSGHPPTGAQAGVRPAVFGAGVALAVLLGAIGSWLVKPVPVAEREPPRRLEISIGADVALVAPSDSSADDAESGLVLSPDGSILAFVGRPEGGPQQIYVRPLDRLTATPLPGTEGATLPFFSPDGASLGFFADGQLKRAAVSGRAVTVLCDAPWPLGGHWGDDGTIVFAEAFNAGLSQVSAAGGTPRRVTALDPGIGETSQRWPQLLPGGRAVLYSSGAVVQWNDGVIVVQTIPDGERKIVHRGYHARYLPTGHLMYVRDERLFAAPFDLETLEVTGEGVPVLDDLLTNPRDGSAYFATSDAGTLVYVPGTYRRPESTIHWLSHSGGLEPLRDTPDAYRDLALSPDGRRLATQVSADDGSADIWIYELDRQAATRLTVTEGRDGDPLWSPTGESLAFWSRHDGGGIFWKRADGSGEARRLTESSNVHMPRSWHPTGRFLAFHELFSDTSWDIRILALEGDAASGWNAGAVQDFLRTPFLESNPTFSPDGRWLAYGSDESGQGEVYVTPFPGPGARHPVSVGGGASPRWSRTDDRLFYLAPDGRIMAVTYTADGDSWQSSRPTALSEVRVTNEFSRNYDQHPDGERFVVLQAEPLDDAAPRRTGVVLIEDFFDQLPGEGSAR